jgi:predicted CoA-substrate-specific enzyme activase
MVTAGVDIGSRTTKAVIVDGQDKVLADAIDLTGIRPATTGQAVLRQACEKVSISREDIRRIVVTGYGRVSADFADKTITEITCHAKGVHFLAPSVNTVIDIGGQDSKVIKLDEMGKVADFAMNDRCAAGTGKFLELTARALETDLENFGALYEKSKKPCSISSVCTVFAESEVISLLAEGNALEDIVSGLHQAIAKRVGNMALRLGVEEDVAFTGGVAKNTGVVGALEEELMVEFHPLSYSPQLAGALGAAMLAKEAG